MSNMTGEASFSSGNRGDMNMFSTGVGTSSNPSQQAPAKRKRNLPGTPDPEAEVVALSPKTLMATNRFVCEICNKGFQRDQNLQLHRRGHNLPWKLRQRTSKEIKKRVYICPETSCVHHHPSRALGDLTGIKKHFCRKHGEKKWKCDKCSKRYAVQSDWKAHSKTCGTREYRCDCGTLFSRRDSFITHRAFCDALAEESARLSGGVNGGVGQMHNQLGVVQGAAPSMSHLMGAANQSRYGGLNPSEGQFNPSAYRRAFTTNGGPSGGIGVNQRGRVPLWLGVQGTGDPQPSNSMEIFNKSMLGSSEYDDSHGGKSLPALLSMAPSNSGSLYSNLFTSGSVNPASSGQQNSESYGGSWTERSSGTARLSLSTSNGLTTNSSSVTNSLNDGSNPSSNVYHGSHSAQMSATALLQKAAQMGATTSNSSMIRGFGMHGSNNSTVGLGLSWQGASQEHVRGHGTVNLMLNNSFNEAHNWNPFMKGPLEQLTQEGGSGGGGGGGGGVYNHERPSRPAENAGLNDLMNSFSGSPSGVSLNAIHSSFSSSMADSGNFSAFNMIPTRPNMNDGTRQSFQMPSMMMQGGGSRNQPRNEDGSEDGLTRDFLGVGGMQLGGLHGRTFSQRDHLAAATFTSLGSAMDMTSFSAQRTENIHPIGAHHGHSPVRSWDAA